MVQRVAVAPPYSRIGPLSDSERAELVQRSPLKGRYDQPIDRESAYEVLASKADAKPEVQGQAPAQQESASGVGGMAGQILGSLLSNSAGHERGIQSLHPAGIHMTASRQCPETVPRRFGEGARGGNHCHSQHQVPVYFLKN